MTVAIYCSFYAGMVLYLVATVAAFCYVGSAEQACLRRAMLALLAGASLLILTFALRWAYWGRLPLTNVVDSLLLLTVLSTAAIFWVLRRPEVRGLLCFYVPPLALICLACAAMAYGSFAEEPRELHVFRVVTHAGLASLAWALFFLACMTSMAYIFQARHLKRHRTRGLFLHLPSLEQLDDTLAHLMTLGYPFFVLTLLTGAAWAWFDHDTLGARWYLAPKVLMSLPMVLFYAIAFHTRRTGRLRGAKLAYFVSIGFSSLIAVYLLLALMNLRNHNFWDTGA